MTDYEFNNNQGDYINYNDALDDIFDGDDNSSFPPTTSDYQDPDMTKEPLVTVDKARFDVFNEYKKEYELIQGIFLSYVAHFRGGIRDRRGCSDSARAGLLRISRVLQPSQNTTPQVCAFYGYIPSGVPNEYTLRQLAGG